MSEEIIDNELLDEQSELYENYRIEIDKGQNPIRIDKFVTEKIQNASRTKVQYACEAGAILVNNKPVKSNYKVKPFDVISILLPHPPKDLDLVPENIPINIVYEDADFLIVNKEAGMVVHPSYGHNTGTLVNAIAYHLKDLPLFTTGEQRPGLVHRIDKNTSGLLVIAKNEMAMVKLAKQFFDKDSQRTYIALVWGNIEENEGTITGHIGRSPKDRRIMFVYPDGEQGKNAVSHYTVLERFGYVTMVECRLETGRTHQIRAHYKYIGHPLFNDEEYGGNQILKGTTFSKYKQFVMNCFDICPRQALHAKTLGFQHPTTGKFVSFDSELPNDMQQLIAKWRKYVAYREEIIEEIE